MALVGYAVEYQNFLVKASSSWGSSSSSITEFRAGGVRRQPVRRRLPTPVRRSGGRLEASGVEMVKLDEIRQDPLYANPEGRKTRAFARRGGLHPRQVEGLQEQQGAGLLPAGCPGTGRRPTRSPPLLGCRQDGGDPVARLLRAEGGPRGGRMSWPRPRHHLAEGVLRRGFRQGRRERFGADPFQFLNNRSEDGHRRRPTRRPSCIWTRRTPASRCRYPAGSIVAPAAATRLGRRQRLPARQGSCRRAPIYRRGAPEAATPPRPRWATRCR